MEIDSETGTQRSCQQTATGGSAHQSKRIQINLYASCRRAFVYHNINTIIFHSRVQILFHYGTQPMYFVDESTSFGSKLVRTPAKSPGLSSTGPEVILKPTPNSLAIILESVVFPNPGGP